MLVPSEHKISGLTYPTRKVIHYVFKGANRPQFKGFLKLSIVFILSSPTPFLFAGTGGYLDISLVFVYHPSKRKV